MTAKPLFLMLAATACAMIAVTGSPAAEPDMTQLLASDNNAFACDLYGQLKSQKGNLFFSPYSISTCVAMAYAGARGETAKQLATAFHFKADPAALAAPFGALQKMLLSSAGQDAPQFNIANGLWAEQTHPFEAEFLRIAREEYTARIEQADFRNEADPVRKEINAWVSKQTKNKINDLMPKGSINDATRLVLVNAIYFKGRWANQFKDNRTIDADFNVTAGQKVKARLMHQTAMFGYSENEDFQLLELSYRGGARVQTASVPGAIQSTPRLSMVVILPRQIDGLKALENKLDEKTLSSWLAAVKRDEVEVFLPKFKTTDKFLLKDTLSEMGVKDAFTQSADFSGMDGQRDLYVSAVVHKAFVDVDEQGTEAAAATGLVAAAASVPVRQAVFRADHPFIFLIRDTTSGSILFMGRLNDPTE